MSWKPAVLFIILSSLQRFGHSTLFLLLLLSPFQLYSFITLQTALLHCCPLIFLPPILLIILLTGALVCKLIMASKLNPNVLYVAGPGEGLTSPQSDSERTHIVSICSVKTSVQSLSGTTSLKLHALMLCELRSGQVISLSDGGSPLVNRRVRLHSWLILACHNTFLHLLYQFACLFCFLFTII